jgi:uncharacterized protein
MTPFDCPRCGTNLTMSERQGIEIDYCPQCRGVWLDRGELDKILDRSAAMPQEGSPAAGGWTQPAPPPPYPTNPPPSGWQGRRDDDWDDRRDSHSGHHGYRGKPRKHWLSELFD